MNTLDIHRTGFMYVRKKHFIALCFERVLKKKKKKKTGKIFCRIEKETKDTKERQDCGTKASL